MKIKILFFGITTDLIEKSSATENVTDGISVFEFKNELLAKYPKLKNINSYAIAVNESYANDDQILQNNDVVALIPPVSGG